MSSYIKEDRLNEFVECMQNKGHTRIKTEKQAKSFLVNHIGELKRDMLQAKIKLVRPIVWKAPLKDKGGADWNELDVLDIAHVKALLQLYREKEEYDFTSDIDCILYDLGQVLKKVKFTKKQNEVLNLWMKGDTVKNIAKELNRDTTTITRNLDTIVRNIVQAYEEELEDIYYLNICKGEYKKCNVCGEVKLTNKFNKNGKQGLMPMCKKCR